MLHKTIRKATEGVSCVEKEERLQTMRRAVVSITEVIRLMDDGNCVKVRP